MKYIIDDMLMDVINYQGLSCYCSNFYWMNECYNFATQLMMKSSGLCPLHWSHLQEIFKNEKEICISKQIMLNKEALATQ